MHLVFWICLRFCRALAVILSVMFISILIGLYGLARVAGSAATIREGNVDDQRISFVRRSVVVKAPDLRVPL